jgi:hypothetical protein
VEFDRTHIVQYGYTWQFETHPDYLGSFWAGGTMFGGGTPGHYTAQVPDAWQAAWEWTYDGIWGSEPWMANAAVEASSDFKSGNPFDSGKVAMTDQPIWYTCCMSDLTDFQLGAMPTYNGEVGGRIDEDTFRIWKDTPHPEEAFEVLSYLVTTGVTKLILGSDEMPAAYSTVPALTADQGEWQGARELQFPSVTQASWAIALEGLNYPDIPSAEGYMPHYSDAWNRGNTFTNLLRSQGGLDLDTEIENYRTDLQVIFNSSFSLPGAFNKLSPVDGAYGPAAGLTLSWESISGADAYEYCYDTTNNDLCDGSWVDMGLATSAAISGLNVSTTYYWQVRATNAVGTTYANGGAGTGTWWALKTSRFADVPESGKEWMRPWIEGFYNAGITTGCGTGPLIYCPDRSVTRAEMAVFLERAMHYPSLPYTPPAASHFFSDMPVTSKEWMEAWVDQFYRDGITTGCGTGPLIYCPERAVTRAEMAVFILRSEHGSGYTPPAASGYFSDVPVTGKEWMESWIDQFYREGITTGCGTGPLVYCPEREVTRAEMAVFVSRAFSIPQTP